MKPRTIETFLLLVCLAGLLAGCSSSADPKEDTRMSRVFTRPPSLVELAVMESGVISNPKRVEAEGGDPVDFFGHNGRSIRVSHLPEQGRTRVTVSYMGFGGPEGARRVLDMIEDWMTQTDAMRDKPVPKLAPASTVPFPTR